jgi:single-strand DNA-binding protein
MSEIQKMIFSSTTPNTSETLRQIILKATAKTLQKGQRITLEGTLRYREVVDEIEGATFKHRISEIHAITMKRLSKIEAADDPTDGAGDE